MHARYSTLSFCLIALAFTAWGQCPFTPTITPDNLILCPNENATLSTQPYDAYQWYKDGSLLPGAVGQTLPVSAMLDAGSTFTVEATLDGCAEMSAGVLVDGWVFLPPYVQHGGDEPVNSGPNLEFCEGDTLLMTLSPGWTHSIVWTNNGIPIPGESSPTLIVTTPGSYSVSAATETCPNYVLGIGVAVDVAFIPPLQPDIVDLGGEICPYPTGNSTQWYLNGLPYSTDDCISPSAPGAYTVFVDYGQPCQAMSEPWVSTDIGAPSAAPAVPDVSPIPASNVLRVQWPAGSPATGAWQLLDMVGRRVLGGKIPATGMALLDVGHLEAGNYLLAAPGFGVRHVVIAR